MADWSSLPSDLVRRIAECLLATNDLDWYMDFRAVCPSWRSATDDPANSTNIRFRPRQWIVIDEVFQTDERLMVNTVTGRILRKDLPLLRKYYVVAVTTNGALFVLADREHPHSARVLNPFTGHMIRFTVPVPYNMEVFSAALSCGSPSNLRLIWDSDSDDLDGYCHLYNADPDSEGFTVYEDCRYVRKRLAVVGGIGNHGEPLALLPSVLAKRIFDVVRLPKGDFDLHQALLSAYENIQRAEPVSLFSAYEDTHRAEPDILSTAYDVLESAGELFLTVKVQHQLKVFRINTDRIVLEPVESIGCNLAFFLGRSRYICVSADKFPSIDANCIYYVNWTDYSSLDIYKYDLEAEKEERISELYPTCTLPLTNSPFTIIQLLSSCTHNSRTSQLTRRSRTCKATTSGLEYDYAYAASDPGSCWCLNMTEVLGPWNYLPKAHGAEVARP